MKKLTKQIFISLKKILRLQILYSKDGQEQFPRYASSFILGIFFFILLIKKDIL